LTGAVLTDAQLLNDFVRRPDASALAVLLQRHSPLVVGVCLRILRHAPDAVDAFQATFLIFVRRAGSIVCGESLASWL
jgi:DNA-directed RNA polymerase specialized sigma24 family protein